LSEECKKRSNYLIVIGIVIGLVIGGASSWFVKPKEIERVTETVLGPRVTEMVTKTIFGPTVTVTETVMPTPTPTPTPTPSPSPSPSPAPSPTPVGGIIWENTIWTLENSPYIITETIQIPEGVTLTIEPGVVVTKPTPGDMFLVQGRIEAHGTIDNKIIFDGGGNSGFFYSFRGEGDFSYCIIKNGYVFWYSETNRDKFNLTHSELTDLKVSGLRYTIHLESPSTDIRIEYNRFINTGGISVYQAAGLFNRVYLEYNLFYNISSSIINHGGTPGRTEMIVKYNSFIDIEGVILSLGELPNAVMDATENYWGTLSTEIINSKIYDRNDDIRIENYIYYLPILTEPHPDTPKLSSTV